MRLCAHVSKIGDALSANVGRLLKPGTRVCRHLPLRAPSSAVRAGQLDLKLSAHMHERNGGATRKNSPIQSPHRFPQHVPTETKLQAAHTLSTGLPLACSHARQRSVVIVLPYLCLSK